jgi:hypothetical protein
MVSKATALKEGKRYDWGSERPGVIQRRIRSRKQQLSKKRAEVKARYTRLLNAAMAKLDDEERFLDEQDALVNAHRERMKERKQISLLSPNYSMISGGDFTVEEVEAVKLENPDVDDEIARYILLKKKMNAANSNATTLESSRGTAGDLPLRPTNAAVQEVFQSHERVVKEPATPAQEAKAPSSESPKPAACHVQASVAVSFESDDAEDNNYSERDWSDFNPDAWEEDQPYPEDRFRDVLREDGCRGLVRRTDLDELVEPDVTPEIQALLDRQQELENAQDALMHRHGRERMKWATEVTTEINRLEEEISAIRKRMAIARDGR